LETAKLDNRGGKTGETFGPSRTMGGTGERVSQERGRPTRVGRVVGGVGGKGKKPFYRIPSSPRPSRKSKKNSDAINGL